MRALKTIALLFAVAVAALMWGRHAPEPSQAGSLAIPRDAGTALPSFLPPEAAAVLSRIARGGPFEHRQDGIVFQNREGRLPREPEGYYHEYTVDTPGLDYRGARRIITGGTPPSIYYYTDDHYRTFRPFEVSR